MQKLSNDQLAEKMRAANRRRSERQRQRRMEAGKVAFTVWIPTNLQKQIVDMATAECETTSAIATRLLQTALNPAPTISQLPPAQVGNAERDAAIVELHRQGGKSLSQIAAALAERGIKTATGNPLSKDTISAAIKRAEQTQPR